MAKLKALLKTRDFRHKIKKLGSRGVSTKYMLIGNSRPSLKIVLIDGLPDAGPVTS